MTLRPRILVVDDEVQIHRFLTPALEAAGYEPIQALTAAEGLRELALRAPDALVLDLGLPDLDGHEALLKARGFYGGPILILSARDREAEKIAALDGGADDYLQKPFGVGELLARLRVALRRSAGGAEPNPIVKTGELEMDFRLGVVRRAGERVRLTPKEFKLLSVLVDGAGKVVTHKQLLTAVWGPAHEADTQYLRVAVGQLRQKLEPDPSAPVHIVTEAGVGYRFLTEAL
ncbi:MAG TPA: winged helix-turn-helix domain-containing protein [Phenylobacterium sp.]|uniref:winged helix-turn-helix domain-containing protein n=1 Tax=Phenylobacterium sp. TaxID=1871053 RepID=UPI002C929C69|nr:winged helix-turn-helix domain-containing protein [Phenylobacterium sp.]